MQATLTQNNHIYAEAHIDTLEWKWDGNVCRSFPIRLGLLPKVFNIWVQHYQKIPNFSQKNNQHLLAQVPATVPKVKLGPGLFRRWNIRSSWLIVLILKLTRCSCHEVHWSQWSGRQCIEDFRGVWKTLYLTSPVEILLVLSSQWQLQHGEGVTVTPCPATWAIPANPGNFAIASTNVMCAAWDEPNSDIKEERTAYMIFHSLIHQVKVKSSATNIESELLYIYEIMYL